MNQAGDVTLARVIGALHPLPSPRGAALELLRRARDEQATVGEIAQIAQADPVLAMRLLHAANSAAQGGGRHTGSIAAAVMQLGLAATRQIALAFSLVEDFRSGACAAFDYREFWMSSLLRGLAARAIAKRLRTGDAHEALACGLLAELGRLALATARPAAYGRLLARHGQRGGRLRAAERESFGVEHGALGAALLGQWHLPLRLARAVEGYFEPPVAADGPERAVRRTVWTLVLAEAVARVVSAPAGARAAWSHLALDGAARLGADAAMLDEVADTLLREASAWTRLLEMPAPALAPTSFPEYAQAGATALHGQAGMRILLVEDDESDGLLARLALEKAGHQVRTAANGDEALAAIAAAVPQILITDLDMPRMNGLDLCRTLRATRIGTSVYIIVLTGRDRHEDMVDCIHAGANDFVSKSVLQDLLVQRVRAAARTVRSTDALRAELIAARNLATDLAIERR